MLIWIKAELPEYDLIVSGAKRKSFTERKLTSDAIASLVFIFITIPHFFQSLLICAWLLTESGFK